MNYVLPEIEDVADDLGDSLDLQLLRLTATNRRIDDIELELLQQIETAKSMLQEFDLTLVLENMKTPTVAALECLKMLNGGKDLPWIKSDKGTCHIDTEGLISGTREVLRKIWDFITRMWYAFTDYLRWYFSLNARYQSSIRRLQGDIASGRRTVLPLNMQMQVLSYVEFKNILNATQDLITWAKTLPIEQFARKLKEDKDQRFYRGGAYIEPSALPLPDTLGRKGWTVTNVTDGLNGVIKLLTQTERGRALERQVERAVKTVQHQCDAAIANNQLSDADRRAKADEMHALVRDCESAVSAVKSLRSLIGRLSMCIINVGTQITGSKP